MARTATKPATANFTEADAFKTWRVLSSNPQYAGTTEGFNFSNGQAVVPALPKNIKCYGCSVDGDLCRLHSRVVHLNNLRNYPTYKRVTDERGKRRFERGEGYRILSEEEYEQEFGEANTEDFLDLSDF